MNKKILSSLLAAMIVTGLSVQTAFADDLDKTNNQPVVDQPVVEDAVYNPDWGTTYEKPVEVTAGKVVQLPEGTDLVKEGFRFVGWNTDPNATVGFFEYKMPNENTTLYAIWVPEEARLCTCNPIDGVHQEGCPFYEAVKPVVPQTPVAPVVPEVPQAPQNPTDKPVEGTPGEQKPEVPQVDGNQGQPQVEIDKPTDKPVEQPAEKPSEKPVVPQEENKPVEPQGGNVTETVVPEEPAAPVEPEVSVEPEATAPENNSPNGGSEPVDAPAESSAKATAANA